MKSNLYKNHKNLLLLFALIQCLSVSYAQVPSTACNGVSASIIINGIHPSEINFLTPTPILTQQTIGLPNTEYLIIKKNTCARDNSGICDTINSGGDVIIGTDADGRFNPLEPNRYGLSLAAGDTFIIIPFAYNLVQLRNFIRGILTGTISGTSNPCCAIFDLDPTTVGFCDTLATLGIDNMNDVNDLSDLLTVVESLSGSELSLNSLLYYLNHINSYSSTFSGTGCAATIDNLVLCYAVNTNNNYSYVVGNCAVQFFGSSSRTNTSNCSANGSASITLLNPVGFIYSWSNGDSMQTAYNLSAGLYSVTVTNSNNNTCSFTESFTITNNSTTATAEICLVSVDSTDGKNLIIWEKPSYQGIKYYKIYKQNSFTSQYDSIAIVLFDSLSVHKDSFSNPSQQSASYRIRPVDSCGVERSNGGADHTTIHLSANQGVNNIVNLQWNAYSGFNYSNFEIYRSNSGAAYSLIGTVANSSFSYSDLTPPLGTNYYYVAVTKPTPCNPTKAAPVLKSVSNILDGNGNPLAVTMEEGNKFSIYPNPADDHVIIQQLGNEIGVKIILTDILGKIIKFENFEANDRFIISLPAVSGIYNLTIISENGIRTSSIVVKK